MKSFEIAATAQQLMAQARAMTGIADIVDAAIEAPLQRLLASLNSEAELSELGAAAMQARLLRLLCNRLRMQRDFRNHPEIEEQKIVRPVFLTGAGRTGSTKMHKMLAASGDFLSLRFWQGYSLSLRSGDRRESPEPRIQEAAEHVRWFDTQTPQAKLIHAYETFEPEEETLLLEHALCGMYLMAFVNVLGYVQWSAQYFPDQLQFMKQALKYLQWQFHDGDPRPWVFKCPIYFGAEPLLAKVFPDAVFVSTHRNPVSTLSSQASLLVYYRKAYSDAERKQEIGSMMCEGQSMATQQFLASRDGRLPCLDIGYGEVTKSAESVIEKVYAHAGLALSDRARRAMQEWETQNSQHKLGVHHHSLEEFSLTPESVGSNFAQYRDRFGSYF